MRGNKLIIIALAMAVFLIGALPSTGQADENEKLKKYYEYYIMKCISKNQSKIGLQESKSANLRSCGKLSQQKVVFLTANKDMLVKEMMKNEIGKKPYKVEYFLNKKFNEMK